MTDFNKFRRDLATTIKSEIEKHEVALRTVRAKELSKTASVDLGCVICGEQNACVCLDPMGVESFLGKALPTEHFPGQGVHIQAMESAKTAMAGLHPSSPRHIAARAQFRSAQQKAFPGHTEGPSAKPAGTTDMLPSGMSKAESKVCSACSQLNCSCSGKLPDDKKSKVIDGAEGSGGKIDTKKLFKKAFKKAAKKLAKQKLEEVEKCGDSMPVKKADAPAAKPPGKSPEASHPTAKVGSPVIKNDGGLPSTGSTTITGEKPSSIPPSTGSTTITGVSPSSVPAPAASGRTSTGHRQATPAAPTSGRSSRGARMALSEASVISENLRKAAGPRLGGRDPASQMMTQHAAMSAPPPAPAAAAPAGPKLTPEDHARRAAGLAEFTPAGAFTPTSPTGSTSGAMQAGAPPALGAPPGLAPSPTAPAPVPAKPMGTSANGGFFDRFKKG